MPSIRSDRTTTVFFPWMRAYNRITKGDDEGVTACYQYLLDDLGGATPPPHIPAQVTAARKEEPVRATVWQMSYAEGFKTFSR